MYLDTRKQAKHLRDKNIGLIVIFSFAQDMLRSLYTVFWAGNKKIVTKWEKIGENSRERLKLVYSRFF